MQYVCIRPHCMYYLTHRLRQAMHDVSRRLNGVARDRSQTRRVKRQTSHTNQGINGYVHAALRLTDRDAAVSHRPLHLTVSNMDWL